jgi:hypothetical protein
VSRTRASNGIGPHHLPPARGHTEGWDGTLDSTCLGI